MQAEDRNYGVEETEATEQPGATSGAMSGGPSGSTGGPSGPTGTATIGPAVGARGMGVRDERAWSVAAHLSVFLNLVTGFFGPVVALLVWLVYRDRSRKVAFHALQSAIYQGAWVLILGAGWAITGLLTVVLIGFLLIPVMALLSIVPFAHGAYAAYKVSKDGEYRYPLVADLIDGR